MQDQIQKTTKKETEVDVAYQLLLATGKPEHFRILINRVLEIRGQSLHSPAHVIAEIHTQINMDSRFIHMGKGMWGLSQWVPQRGGRYAEDGGAATVDSKIRREKLLEEIQQDYAAAASELDETEEHA